MLTDNTISKLHEMHLSAMAKAFKEQIQNPDMNSLSFEDRFSLIVDQEWTTRKSNHLTKLIRKAGFADPGACMENIDYLSERKLDKTQLLRLSSCRYISEHNNVILLGATGSGKTYLACALGMAAVRSFLPVRYVRLPDLLTELALARASNTYRKVIGQYEKPALLIIDEWLLYPLKETEARDLLEIMERRYHKGSTIFCSQFDIPGWPSKIGDPVMADAICDRIVHNAYSVIIDCKESMRKLTGLSSETKGASGT